MAQSYLNRARRHLDKIKYYHDQAGVNGYSQSEPHYNGISECYRKSNAKRSGETPVIHSFYLEAGRLMIAMQEREKRTSDPDKAVDQ